MVMDLEPTTLETFDMHRPRRALRPELRARQHAISAGHYLAAQAGMRVLDAGGNAADAGVAAGICLGFLGFGVPPPRPDLGGMLSGAGLQFMRRSPWLAVWPGTAITLIVFAFNVFGDALRDLLDPRLRGR